MGHGLLPERGTRPPKAAIALVAGAVNGYLLKRRRTFRTRDTTRGRLRYLAVQAGSLVATTNPLWLLVTDADVRRFAAHVVAISVITMASFVANRV